MTLRLSYRLLIVALFVVAGTLSASAQQSDKELLRQASFEAPREDRSVPYGIEQGRTTLSPLYHSASGALWLWENLVAADICAPGGYTDTNTAYFKGLVVEYGAPLAVIYGLDRMVRNTKIGRHSTPKNNAGLIEDSVERYRR